MYGATKTKRMTIDKNIYYLSNYKKSLAMNKFKIKQVFFLFFVLTFCIKGEGQTVVFTEDFESGLGGFAPSGNVSFTINNTLSNGGSKSAHNIHGVNNNNYLTQIVGMDLTVVSDATLKFWHIAKTESGWDDCVVQVSVDGGGTWNAISPVYDEDDFALWGTTNVTPDNTWWKEITLDLTPYITQTDVRIRFWLDSDGTTNRYGWLIDDVTLTGTPIVLNDVTSTIVAGALSDPTSISSLVDTEPEKLSVFDFTFQDPGSGDGLSTIIDALIIEQGAANSVADWTSVIAGARIDGPDQTNMIGTINATKITFSSNDMIIINDGGAAETYTLKIWLSTSMSPAASIDGSLLDFKIDDESITIDIAGSSFGTNQELEHGGLTIDVVATKLSFSSGPPTSHMFNSNFSTTVQAQDENNHLDIGAIGSVAISAGGLGTISSANLIRTLTSGQAVWTDLQYDMQENNVVITASHSGTYAACDNSATSGTDFVSISIVTVGSTGTYTTIQTAYDAIKTDRKSVV